MKVLNDAYKFGGHNKAYEAFRQSFARILCIKTSITKR